MGRLSKILDRNINWRNLKNHFTSKFLVAGIGIILFVSSCNSDPYGTHWTEDDMLTICQFLDENEDEYSKFRRILFQGMMLDALCAYNPYGEDYTLFLPTNEAIDNFIEQSPQYRSFDELLEDQGFINNLTRYHTVNKKLHTDDFPDGALTDLTLSGDRLTTAFHRSGDSMIIKINRHTPVIKSNLEMANGYIHVVSEVLKKTEVNGYEWLQQHDDYSILAQAMEYSRIPNKLGWNKYTILAEPDSVYHRKGIYSVEDLDNFISATGNHIYDFVTFHILNKERYLNDLDWGRGNYWTLAKRALPIVVGQEIRVNPGIQDFDTIVSEPGDTTIINYVRLIRDESNILTSTGPVHAISDLLFFEPLP